MQKYNRYVSKRYYARRQGMLKRKSRFAMIVAILLIAAIVYMLFRKNKYDDNTLTVTTKKAKSKATK